MNRLLPLLLGGSAWLAVGCVGVPAAPEPSEDLTALSHAYEHPTASVPEELVPELLEASESFASWAVPLSGLGFARDGISDASVGLAKHTNVEDLNVQGRVDATVACPGDDAAPSSDPGSVAATLGVKDSRLKRGFEGTFKHCRFSVTSEFTETQHVFLDSHFVADLGADIRIGSKLPHALLVVLRNPVGTSSGTTGSIALDGPLYHFRLTDDDAVEVLVESVLLGEADLGTVVIVLKASGFVGLREQRGLWSCGSETEPCVLL